MNVNFNNLVEMSRMYGSDEKYVLAGGGNTSYKENGVLYVKGSGVSLSDITADRFVAMDLDRLLEMARQSYSDDISDEEREAKALSDMMAACLPGEETKRPSVEALLHALFPQSYVLHTHPALINGMTCGKTGKKDFERLFADEAVWVGLTKPGLILAQVCNGIFEKYSEKKGNRPQIAIIKNHGIFVAADTVEEIHILMANVMSKVKSFVQSEPDFCSVDFDRDIVCSMAPALRMLYAQNGTASALFCVNKEVAGFVADKEAFSALIKPFTPDHIVYCRDEPLFIEPGEDLSAAFTAYETSKGYKPKIVAVRGLGFFALGSNRGGADKAWMLFLDAVKVAIYARSFGGVDPLPDDFTEFISNWEAETYRKKTLKTESSGRLEGKIAIVTGGGQGFGKGIAEAIAAEGARVAIADVNPDSAKACADSINEEYGDCTAIAVTADVSDEESVQRMIEETVLAFGGLDIFVSNAGVLIAGGLEEMTKEHFDFVTKVNYTGYFICVKYAAKIMKIQREYAPEYMADIIEINSKSGLEGSNKNFAYAGSKFGGIGLTQSFALELAEHGIKVNAICPGNLLDGPLWSDPERGLFKQYLDSGKVPGAKTIADVRRFYESKVPLGRGCTVRDVACALLYIVEQEYETGQAVPVTGGQIALN